METGEFRNIEPEPDEERKETEEEEDDPFIIAAVTTTMVISPEDDGEKQTEENAMDINNNNNINFVPSLYQQQLLSSFEATTQQQQQPEAERADNYVEDDVEIETRDEGGVFMKKSGRVRLLKTDQDEERDYDGDVDSSDNEMEDVREDDDRASLKQDSCCPICLDTMKPSEFLLTTECHHTFHYLCIQATIVHVGLTCPLCRRVIHELSWLQTNDVNNNNNNNSNRPNQQQQQPIRPALLPPRIPSRLRIRSVGDVARIICSREAPPEKCLDVFVFPFSVLFMVAVGALAVGILRWIALEAGIAVAMILLPLSYISLRRTFNRTVLTVNDGKIQVRYGPIPPTCLYEIPVSEVTAVYVTEYSPAIWANHLFNRNQHTRRRYREVRFAELMVRVRSVNNVPVPRNSVDISAASHSIKVWEHYNMATIVYLELWLKAALGLPDAPIDFRSHHRVLHPWQRHRFLHHHDDMQYALA